MSWTLILNDEQTTMEFTSERKLRQWAELNLYEIHKSPTSHRCFYTLAHMVLPADCQDCDTSECECAGQFPYCPFGYGEGRA